MNRRNLLFALGCGALALSFVGCDGGAVGGGDVKLTEAGGVVKFRGGPLAGAAVTFVPEKGPVATGTTDLEGKFKLSSGAMKGVAVGKCKVAVSVYEAGSGPADAASAMSLDTSHPPASPEEAQKRMQSSIMMKSMQAGGGADTSAAVAKSVIPEKFANPEKSGLTAEVTNDPAKNQFTFDLGQ